MIYDITPWLNCPEPLKRSDGYSEFFISIPKKELDKMTGSDLEIIAADNHYKSQYRLITYDSNYDNMSDDYDIHISIVVEELEWSKRNKKIQDLGI